MIRRVLSLAMLAFTISSSAVAEAPMPNMNGKLVMDYASLIPADREAALATELHRFSVEHGPQIAVVTIPTLDGADPADYSNRALRHLKLGDINRNDGVLLVIAVKEHKSRIEVGYGLEPVLTDAVSNQINRNTIVPKFKEGDYAGGIEDGVKAIEVVVTPKPAESVQEVGATNNSNGGWLFLIAGGSLLLFALWLAVSKIKADRKRKAAILKAENARRRQADLDRARFEREAREALRAQRRDRTGRINEDSPIVVVNRVTGPGPTMVKPRTLPAKPAKLHRNAAITTAAVASTAEVNRREAEANNRRRREREAEEERAARRRREEREEADRRSSSYSASYSSSDSSSSSSSDSGGGGSSGGGGDTSSW